MDKGGTIYTLSPEGFEQASEIGVNIWVIPNPVKPVSKEVVSSALKAMIEASIQVYFVSPEILEKFTRSKEKRLEILQGLVSENNKRSI